MGAGHASKPLLDLFQPFRRSNGTANGLRFADFLILGVTVTVYFIPKARDDNASDAGQGGV